MLVILRCSLYPLLKIDSVNVLMRSQLDRLVLRQAVLELAQVLTVDEKLCTARIGELQEGISERQVKQIRTPALHPHGISHAIEVHCRDWLRRSLSRADGEATLVARLILNDENRALTIPLND